MYNEYGEVVGSFAVLKNPFEEFSVVFVDTVEVIYYLKPKAIKVADVVELIDFPELRRRVRDRRDLARIVKRASIVIASDCVREVDVDIEGVKYREVSIGHLLGYCYGVVRRGVRTIDANRMLQESELIAVKPELEDIVVALKYFKPRLPRGHYGLIIDRIRSSVVEFSVATAGYIVEDDIEELREMQYGQMRIAVLVVKKLTFSIADLWKPREVRRRLIDVLVQYEEYW